MEVLDLSQDQAIGQLSDLLRRVSLAPDPAEIQRAFSSNLRQRPGADAYVSLSRRGLPDGHYKVTRAQFGDELASATDDPWKNWNSLPEHHGGFLGGLIRTPTAKLLTRCAIRDDPVMGDRLAPFGACIAVPLFDAGEALNWGVVLRNHGRDFTKDDAWDFFLRGNLIGGLTRNLIASRQIRDLNARYAAQLEEIAQVQRALLPSMLPEIKGLSLAASYLTSNEAGGDYYDFFDMGNGSWGVVIADVSSHGAGAATVMAMLQTILHAYQERSKGPAAMLTHANRELCRKRFDSTFVTAFMGVIDPSRSRLVYSNAGHNRPELRRSSGLVSPIDGAASLPLGILEDTRYEHSTATLGPLDTIVMYTDGVTEALSPPPLREMFGANRLTQALELGAGEPICVIDSIHARLYDHTRTITRQDDQTIVVLRIDE